MVFAPPFQRPFSATFDKRAAVAAVPWWLAGGVAAANAVAVYQPKGAASLAASYVNLANPGTSDAAPGTAPTFDAATGWTFAAASSQYLTTGVTGNKQNWTYLVRYSNASGSGIVFGSLEAIKLWGPRVTIGRIYYGATFFDRGAMPAAAIYCQSGPDRYLDGASDGTFAAQSFTGTTQLEIGRATGITTLYFSGNVQAVAIYNTTLTSTQVGLISAAMAAL